LDLIADCNADRRPDYYRLSFGATGTGAAGGIVTDDKKAGVGNATVTLYRQGKGPVNSTSTDEVGRFGFSGLQLSPEEYWISIAGTGFFLEELRHLVIRRGFESVYMPIILESCNPGRCRP